MMKPDHTSPGLADSARQRLVGADRTLAVLAELAKRPVGVQLEELARAVDSPRPTVHRALVALRRAGFAAQDGHGRYLLGNEFVRLAFLNHEGRPDHVRVLPTLLALCERYGETIHYSVLDQDRVIYQAKVDPPIGGVRLTSVIGGSNPAHCTAVGKLMLAQGLPDRAALKEWIGERKLEQRTERTLTSLEALDDELAKVREQGFAVDDEENEPGINCLAFPAYVRLPTRPSGGISISALAYRTPLAKLVDDRFEALNLFESSISGSPV